MNTSTPKFKIGDWVKINPAPDKELYSKYDLDGFYHQVLEWTKADDLIKYIPFVIRNHGSTYVRTRDKSYSFYECEPSPVFPFPSALSRHIGKDGTLVLYEFELIPYDDDEQAL